MEWVWSRPEIRDFLRTERVRSAYGVNTGTVRTERRRRTYGVGMEQTRDT